MYQKDKNSHDLRLLQRLIRLCYCDEYLKGHDRYLTILDAKETKFATPPKKNRTSSLLKIQEYNSYYIFLIAQFLLLFVISFLVTRLLMNGFWKFF